jgi:hypothetical protein
MLFFYKQIAHKSVNILDQFVARRILNPPISERIQ